MRFYEKWKKGIIIICSLGIILLVVMLIYAFVTGQPKTPATCSQVTTELTNLGYYPTDTTSIYIEQDSHLQGSVAIENEKLRFDFFEFDNNNSASNVFSHAYNQIIDYRSSNKIESDEYYSNYRMYSLKSNGMFYITIRVENTAIYAYCDEGYTSEIGRILSAIGYVDSK
jgi:hypothetical protein